MKKKPFSTYKLVFWAMMAAIVCVVTLFRFPLLGSKVHFANTMCLLSGLLFGPVGGGIAAGLGSALYDALFDQYELIQCLVTFASKFMMAFVCAVVARSATDEVPSKWRVLVSCILGAITYVVLYMLKTFIFQKFVYGFPVDAVWVTMLSKLPASLINAVFAVITAPILYFAIAPTLRRSGLLKKLK